MSAPIRPESSPESDQYKRVALELAKEIGIDPGYVKDRSLRFVTNHDGKGHTLVEWDGIALVDDDTVVAIWNGEHSS